MWMSYCLSVGLKGGNVEEKALPNFISLSYSVYYHPFVFLFPVPFLYVVPSFF
jgi:hypothetical protein